MQDLNAAVLSLIVAGSALAAEPLRLQALVPTSGSGAEHVVDKDVATGWKPEGDPVDEGLILRWEKPATFEQVLVKACPGATPLAIEVEVNGETYCDPETPPAMEAECSFPEQKARTLSIQVIGASTRSAACVGTVQLFNSGKPLELLPPRSVEGSIQASSVLEPTAAYAPAFLFDGRLDFGWAEGAKGPGVGEWLTVTLAAPIELTALELWNGHQRSQEHFRKNARASQLSLTLDASPPVPLTVKDVSGAQVLKLPQPLKGRILRLKVDKAKAGPKFPDLVLSELLLVDPQGPLTVRTPELEQQRKELLAQVAGTGLEKIVDGRWRKRCEAETYVVRTLKLRANRSFVFHDVVAETGKNSGEYDETVEGAWVVKKVEAPWTTVELFGRRHRFDSVLKKVAGEWDFQEVESQRAGGGTLEIARVADLGEQAFQQLVAEWAQGPQRQVVECVGEQGHTYADLVASDAFFIRGKTVTELLSRYSERY
jgi:hypothetical protein